jgi:hypothetical protein
MATAVSDILRGPVRVFYAAVGTALPADSTAHGASWGGSWTDIGYTMSSLAMKYDVEELDLEVEQHLAPIGRIKSSEQLTLETTLASITSANLALGIEGSATTTAAGTGQVAKDELVAGDDALMTERAWGFEGHLVDSTGATRPVRVLIYKATSTFNGELEFGKKVQPGIALQIKALVDPTQTAGQRLFKLQRVTGAAT